jgi:tape measure domain-containing protein
MSSEVGSGHFSVFPVMPGFRATVAKEAQGAGLAGAKAVEGGFKGSGAKAGRALGSDLRSAMSSAAGDLASASLGKFTSEVGSASAALAKVRLKQQDDAGKVRIAETRLAEAIARSGAESSQAVAAEERLAAARRTHASTTDTVATASARLRAAQDSLRGAQDAAARSSDNGRSRLQGFASAAQSGLSTVVGAVRNAGERIGESLGAGFQAAQTTAGIALGAIALKVASLVPDAGRASDAVDKFKSTLDFAGLDGAQIDALAKSTQAYADSTVYDLADIQGVTATLAANSVKDFDKLAEAGGNLNAIAGGNKETFKSLGSVLTQTAGQGKLTTENWNQLSDAIPGAAGKLSEALLNAGAYTGNFREAMEKGEISAEEFNNAILDLGLTDVAKEAATSTSTFEGAIGGLNSAITGGLVKVITPLKPLITGVMGAAAGAFTSFFDKVSLGVEGLVSLFGAGDFTSAFREAFGVAEDSPIVDFLLKARDGVMGFTGSLPSLAAFAGPLVAILGAGGLAGVLAKLGPLTALLPGLGGALSILGGPLGLVAAGFAGLALSGGDIGGLVTGLTSVVSGVASALPGIVQQVATVVPQLVSAVLAQVPTLLSAGTEIITALIAGLVTAIPALAAGALTLVQGLLTGIVAALPLIITGAITLVTALIQGLVTAIPLLITAALQLVTGLLTAIIAALPMIIEGGIQLLLALVMGIVGALPELLTAALGLVMGLLQAIIDNLPMLIEAGIQLLLSLVTGLIGALPQLITAAISLVLQLVVGLLTMLPKLIEAGIQLVVSLITGLVGAIPKIIDMLPQIVEAIWNGLIGVDWLDLGVQIVMGIINGLASMGGALVDAIVDLASGAFEGFKDFFGIASPSKLMRKETKWVVKGAALGVEDEASTFSDSLVKMARSASGKAQAEMGVVAEAVASSATSRAGSSVSADVARSVNQTTNIYPQETDPVVLGKITGRTIVDQLAGM